MEACARSGTLKAGGCGELGVFIAVQRPKQRTRPKGLHRLPAPQHGVPMLASLGSIPRGPALLSHPSPRTTLPSRSCTKPHKDHGCHTALAQLGSGLPVCTQGFFQGTPGAGVHTCVSCTCGTAAWHPRALEGPLRTSRGSREQAPWPGSGVFSQQGQLPQQTLIRPGPSHPMGLPEASEEVRAGPGRCWEGYHSLSNCSTAGSR